MSRTPTSSRLWLGCGSAPCTAVSRRTDRLELPRLELAPHLDVDLVLGGLRVVLAQGQRAQAAELEDLEDVDEVDAGREGDQAEDADQHRPARVQVAMI